jgi:DNA-binding response OmpR family regulator
VVDDDADIRQLLQDRLQSDGYVIHTAVNGREALESLRQYSFNGVILDIGMPEVDGFEVLRQIRMRQAAMPVVMITAVEARERALLAMEAGAQGYLLKPFTSAQLQHMVDRWFRPELVQTEGGGTKA